MMRSESTSALGQPRLTNPILGPLRGAAFFETALSGAAFGMGALIGKRGTLVCRRVEACGRRGLNEEACRPNADDPRMAAFWRRVMLAISPSICPRRGRCR